MLPGIVGVKLSTSVQEDPTANVAVLETGESCGQVELLSRVKFAEILGFWPVVGISKVNAALPWLVIVTVCGLSVLVAPTTVVAKLSVGGVTTFSSMT